MFRCQLNILDVELNDIETGDTQTFISYAEIRNEFWISISVTQNL